MISNACFALLLLTLPQTDGKLTGQFEVIARVTRTEVELQSPKSTWQFQFEENGMVTWINTDPDYAGIPYSGAKMNVTFDTKTSPKRFKIWFNEGVEKTTFAYGIYKRKDGNLVMKLLLPLGLSSNGTPDDIKRFAKSPYPTDFSPPEPKKSEILYILKSSNTKKNKR